MSAGWTFLALSAVLLGLTGIALRPARRPAPVAIGAFGVGMVVSELALHHLAWQLLAAGAWVAAGALREPPGRLGALVLAANAAGLVWLHVEARRARRVLAEALSAWAPTGDDTARPPPSGEDLEVPGAPTGRRGRRVEAMRSGRVCRLSDRLLPVPVRFGDLERLADVPYVEESGHPRQVADVYRRPGLRDAPIFVFVHGGGWVLGSRRDQGLPLVTAMARNGWLAVAADYRLSPEATWPDHLHDVFRALRWVRRHAGDLGGDPRTLVIAGNSAGAHLAALAALAPEHPALAPPFDAAEVKVDAAVCLYGVYDILDRHATWPHDGLRKLWASKILKVSWRLRPDLYDVASPIAHVGPHAPPFFVVHGSRDSVVPVEQARRFVAALGEASHAGVAYAELPGAQHAYDVMWSERAVWQARAVVHFCQLVDARRRAAAVRPTAVAR